VGSQTPEVHLVVPLALVQLLPQAPQFVVVVRLASQPFVRASPSQLPQPTLQMIEQAPSEQAAEPLAVLQGLLHEPQCPSVICVLVSQPLAFTPSQLPQPALQAPRMQLPPTHDSAAFGMSHSFPQPPQC
jgi:hypothetical protein